MNGESGEQPVGRRQEPPLKPLDLLSVLLDHGVGFVVIGGFSLAAHGYVRGTQDLDIVPRPTGANLERLMVALRDLDAEPLAIGDFDPDEVLDLTLENLELGGNWLLRTRLGRLDVMQYVEGLHSYGRLRDRALVTELPGFEAAVPFAGYDDLVALKRASARDQDLLDIAELERLRGART